MHARPANCTSSRERRFKVGLPANTFARGSAILFLAACRATLILGDRGHKGRRVGRLAGEREEKSPLLSIWIRRRDENTPFVSSNACPFSLLLASLPVPPSRVPPFLSAPNPTRVALPRPRRDARPESAPLSCFGDNERTTSKRSPLTTQSTRLV